MAVRLENDAADLVRVSVVCVTGDEARREAVVVVDARGAWSGLPGRSSTI